MAGGRLDGRRTTEKGLHSSQEEKGVGMTHYDVVAAATVAVVQTEGQTDRLDGTSEDGWKAQKRCSSFSPFPSCAQWRDYLLTLLKIVLRHASTFMTRLKFVAPPPTARLFSFDPLFTGKWHQNWIRSPY